jgi:hypothetical protein
MRRLAVELCFEWFLLSVVEGIASPHKDPLSDTNHSSYMVFNTFIFCRLSGIICLFMDGVDTCVTEIGLPLIGTLVSTVSFIFHIILFLTIIMVFTHPPPCTLFFLVRYIYIYMNTGSFPVLLRVATNQYCRIVNFFGYRHLVHPCCLVQPPTVTIGSKV